MSKGLQIMKHSTNKWVERINIFSNILVLWKVIGAICIVIASPTYERMNEDAIKKITNDWFTTKLVLVLFIICAVAGYIARTKLRILSLLIFFIVGSVYFYHYIYICKLDLLSIFLAYWEFLILSFMLWRKYKEDKEQITVSQLHI